MQKTILLTGAKDGIGLETAKVLIAQDHNLLIHGRNPQKLSDTQKLLEGLGGKGKIETYKADLSDLNQVKRMAQDVLSQHAELDVLINNAGIFKTSEPIAANGLDVRFVVNTLAPYLLTKLLLPLFGSTGRIVNLSSAAQAPVNIEALKGNIKIEQDFEAYAQSKLAITMWSAYLAKELSGKGPLIVAVNPASMLGSKMVKEGFGVAGGDLGIGADILVRAALSDELTDANGKYYDNDAKQFAPPHIDALDHNKIMHLTQTVNDIMDNLV